MGVVQTAGVPSKPATHHCWLQDREAWQPSALSHLGNGKTAASPAGFPCRLTEVKCWVPAAMCPACGHRRMSRSQLSSAVPAPVCIVVPQGGPSLQPVLYSMWVWCLRPRLRKSHFPQGAPPRLAQGSLIPAGSACGCVGAANGLRGGCMHQREGSNAFLPSPDTHRGLPQHCRRSALQSLGLSLPHKPRTEKGSGVGVR